MRFWEFLFRFPELREGQFFGVIRLRCLSNRLPVAISVVRNALLAFGHLPDQLECSKTSFLKKS